MLISRSRFLARRGIAARGDLLTSGKSGEGKGVRARPGGRETCRSGSGQRGEQPECPGTGVPPPPKSSCRFLCGTSAPLGNQQRERRWRRAVSLPSGAEARRTVKDKPQYIPKCTTTGKEEGRRSWGRKDEHQAVDSSKPTQLPKAPEGAPAEDYAE